jgi:hypothetical protein
MFKVPNTEVCITFIGNFLGLIVEMHKIQLRKQKIQSVVQVFMHLIKDFKLYNDLINAYLLPALNNNPSLEEYDFLS